MMKSKTSIFGLFGPSPIRPLQQHMSKAFACAQLLITFFRAVLDNDWEEAEKIQIEISATETEADEIKKDLRLHLPKGLFLPVPRTDILELLVHQDRIANKAEDIAGLVIGRKMKIPKDITSIYLALLERCIDAARQANKAIHELDELLETGFRGNEVSIVQQMIVELDKIESDTDVLQKNIRQELFNLENKLPPIDVIFLYKVIEWTGDLADRAQTVGGELHLLLAR